jgi:hypothetical protein
MKTLPEIDTALPVGFLPESRNGILAIFYPPRLSPLEALRIAQTAGAQGYNLHVSGPCLIFPRHCLSEPVTA